MAESTSRRRFLQTAPLAAAVVSLPLSDGRAAAAQTTVPPPAQTTAAAANATPVPFKLIPAQELAQQTAALLAKPGNFNFFENTPLPFACVLTVEQGKSAKEFEWHEGRDHILQILDGETVYELGGTTQNGHSPKPGEWLAPISQGATRMTLKKGDVVIIPRNTPHKRSTAGSVTFFLFSPSGAVGA